MNFDDLSMEPLNDLMLLAASEGGIPTPNGYAEDGRPLWSIDSISAFFGTTPKQIDKAIDDAFESLADVAWAGPVHRAQQSKHPLLQ